MKPAAFRIVLVLVVVALVAWFFASRRTHEGDAATDKGVAAQAPVDVKTEYAAAEGAPQPEPARENAPEAERKPESKLKGRLEVAGRLTLAAGAVPLADCAVMLLSGERSLTGDMTASQGNYALGVPFVDAEPPSDLRLEVQAQYERVHVQDLPAAAFTYVAELESWKAAVDITLAGTVVQGQVIDDRDQPLGDAGVAVIDGGEGEALMRQLMRKATGPDGRFQIVLGAQTEASGVLVASPGFVPQLVRRRIGGGGLVDLGTLKLGRGVTISGRVISSFPPEDRVSIVMAHLDVGGQWMSDTVTGQLRWEEGSLYQDYATAKVAADGTFVISGLAEREYIVDARREPNTSRAKRSMPAQQVTAPAIGVEFFDDGALVRLRARERATGEAIKKNLMLRFEGESFPPNGALASDAGVPRAFYVDPLTDFRGVASVDGYKDVPFAFVTPGAGGVLEQDLLFDVAPQARDVRFRVVTEEGEPVSEVLASLEPATKGAGRVVTVLPPTNEGGRFVMSSAPNDPLRLTVSYHGRRIPGAPNLLVPGTVDVPPDLREELTVVLRNGGLVELHVTNPAGEPLPARCGLIGADGTVVPLRCMEEGPPIAEFDGWVGPRGRALAVQPLTPGRYELRVDWNDHTPATVPVEISAGEITTTKVVLTPTN
jgi:hypothetical protein